MPGGDGTGPMGTGPIGWGMGPCGRGLARRMARGIGRGFGWRASVPLSFSKDEEEKILKAELEQIDSEKAEIEKRLKEIKK